MGANRERLLPLIVLFLLDSRFEDDIQEVLYRSYVLQGFGCVEHTFRTLLLRM